MELLIKTLCLSNRYFFLNIREIVTLSFYVEMLTLFFFKSSDYFCDQFRIVGRFILLFIVVQSLSIIMVLLIYHNNIIFVVFSPLPISDSLVSFSVLENVLSLD